MKAEGEGSNALGFESGNDEKDYVHVYEGDDEDEDGDYDDGTGIQGKANSSGEKMWI